MSHSNIIVLGHRGYSSLYPENSILAFKKAIEAGADGIELDVWLTLDGKVVVIHDRNIDRTTNGHGDVKRMTIEQLKEFNLEMDEKIPTLEEVFKSLPRNVIVNIEIKDPEATEQVAKIVTKNNPERVIISSFAVESLIEYRSYDRKSKIALLVKDKDVISHIPLLKKEIDLEFVNIPIESVKIVGLKETTEILRFINSLNIDVGLWAIRDTEFYRDDVLLTLKGLFRLVITDDVRKMIKYLRQIGLK